MQHAELPVGAFIAAALVLVPISWHWRARSIPTLSVIAWLFFDNLVLAVNTIVWADNVRIVAPVWCDIAVRVEYASNIALPAACLCLTIRLERISSARTVSTTASSKRRWMLFDTAMCWGLPMLYLGLYYIVQGHRFDIVENLGCRFTFYVSVAGLFLVMIPPLLLSFLTLIFAGLSLVHFFRRRIDFNRHLAASGSALTTARYFRLMLMAIVLMLWVIAVTSVNVWFSSRTGLRPWISWDDVHSNWRRVGQFPLAFLSTSDRAWVLALWWAVPISAYINASFFVFGEDALKEYRTWWAWIRTKVFRLKPATKKSAGAILYTHELDNMPSARKFKRDTIVSFTDTAFKDTKADCFSMEKPIFSPAALRSFAISSSTHGSSSLPSPMPSTPSDNGMPPTYEYADEMIDDSHFHEGLHSFDYTQHIA